MAYRGGWRFVPPLMKSLNVVGSDVNHFECPWCGCSDRERHLLLYMERANLLSCIENKMVLHFAPEKHLSIIIKNRSPKRYIPCDLYPQSNNLEKIDILSIPYENDFFDLLIANHILEHVENDQKALSEINRVLKPGGYAILQTPFSAVLKNTWFDEGIVDEDIRMQAYGQEDHVRLFGQDIFSRFVTQGLVSEVKSHDEILGDIDCFKFGINKCEPFFLYRKPYP